MDASDYFALLDAIADARTPERLAALEARVAAAPMHPFARRAVERAVRERSLALSVGAGGDVAPIHAD